MEINPRTRTPDLSSGELNPSTQTILIRITLVPNPTSTQTNGTQLVSWEFSDKDVVVVGGGRSGGGVRLSDPMPRISDEFVRAA